MNTPTMAPDPTAGGRHGWRIVAALATTSTVGYGTLYYAYAVLLSPMAASLQASTTAVTGALTASSLRGGAARGGFGLVHVVAGPLGRQRGGLAADGSPRRGTRGISPNLLRRLGDMVERIPAAFPPGYQAARVGRHRRWEWQEVVR